MAQIIKNRRGSIGNAKDVTTQNGEIIVASGSIGDLSGPFILYGSPTPSDNGLTGVYKPASKIYQGANVPTINVGTYGNVLDGTPFYSSVDKALYILNAAGNTLMDLAGNLSGSVFPYIIASGSFSGSFQGDGSGLTNISASSIVGLSLNSIQTGSVTASVDIGNVTYRIVSASADLFSVYNTGLVGISGSLIVTNGITGSLFGTSSYAVTASYVATASYTPNLQEVTNQGNSTTTAITSSGLYVNGVINVVNLNQSSLISNNYSSISDGYNIFIGNGGTAVTGITGSSIAGSYNTSLGIDSLSSLTTGYQNTAIGFRALFSNSTSSLNTAIGFDALRFNLNGYGNVALGINTLTLNNDGYLNTAIGSYALSTNVSGYQNTALGMNAGRYIAAGTNNSYPTNSLFLGFNTRPSTNGNTNEIVIGANAYGNGSNSVTLGDTLITKTILRGNVLLGGTSDNIINTLQVSGSVIANSFTGSLQGTASYASQALSASFASTALTASYIATASYTPNLQEVTNQGSSTTNALTMSGAFINGNTVISGDLDVNGTVTYISSSTLQIGDNIIEINYNKAAGNSGMIVYDTTAPYTASMLWDATLDRWIAGPYGSESVIILASDTSSMSVNFARTASYSTTLGASLSSPNPNQVRLLASDGGTLSTVTVNNVDSASYALSSSYALTSTSASYALTSSYANPLIQNLIVTGSVTATTGFYDGTGAGVIQFAYLNASKQLAYLTPSTTGDLIQWNGTAMTASNLIDGGTF